MPNYETDEKLSPYVSIINKLIEQSLKPTQHQLKQIQDYMSIFDKKVDNIITELKKKSFDLQNDLDDDDAPAADNAGGSQEDLQGEEEIEERGEGEENSEDQEDSYGDEDDEDEDDEEGYAGNDRAY